MPRVVNCLPTDAVDLALPQSEVDALLFPSDSSGASYTRKCSTSDSVATDLQLLSLFLRTLALGMQLPSREAQPGPMKSHRDRVEEVLVS